MRYNSTCKVLKHLERIQENALEFIINNHFYEEIDEDTLIKLIGRIGHLESQNIIKKRMSYVN